MAKYVLDMERFRQVARQAAAEGCVLLYNEKDTLPVKENTNIAVFGRSAWNYYKSGTGSGGLVNTRYVLNIIDALKEYPWITLNDKVLSAYQEWILENPFDRGQGWGGEPYCQKEMPVSDDLVEIAAEESDMAIIIIGRTAGEGRDLVKEAGGYYLTDTENAVLDKVCRAFDKVAVLLNTGNTIDMSWVTVFKPSAVLYIWQGGQEGGKAAADVLTGTVNPCGKLTDTIAYNLEDYPSTKNFGNEKQNIYQEDIYVGYRYFETFEKKKVLYPFGYGCSYTSFDVKVLNLDVGGNFIKADVCVKNTGEYSGKEVVQLYISAPQGKLGKPARELKSYAKTNVLNPEAEEILHLCVSKQEVASYDDSGVTGNKSCYVLEAGKYAIYIGTDVRSAVQAGMFTVEENIVMLRLNEALAPVMAFNRLKPAMYEHGSYQEVYETVPVQNVSSLDKIKERRANEQGRALAFTGNKGYKLKDVYDGRVDLNTFLAQLTDEDLMCLVRGEGMCSKKVTAGTAGAFGGVTEPLKELGIPIACCADGPSGIRMDCGTLAFAMPCGTALGCTFNTKLVEELYVMEGLELRKNQIDTLLGPGMNIHRNPLNGRNFEYISEDPYVTGTIAAAQLKGMSKAGVTGTIKHFAANNQEFSRHQANSVVSERALREIYLKGFEIAVKDGRAYSIMTSYGAINGIRNAGNYDLVTAILRDEWHFDGIVMTDWWASMNEIGGKPSPKNTGVMIRAQNDLFMVATDSATNGAGDTSAEALKNGVVTRDEFVRSAANICRVLMRFPVMQRFIGREAQDDLEVIHSDDVDGINATNWTYYNISDDTSIDLSNIRTEQGHNELFGISLADLSSFGTYEMWAKLSSDSSDPLAQMSMSVFVDNQLKGTFVLNGTNGETVTKVLDLGMVAGLTHYVRLYFATGGMKVYSIRIKKTGDFNFDV